MILTQSAYTTFASCRKRAELRYERGLVPMQEPTALRFGSLIHDAIERHHRGLDALAWITAQPLDAAERIYALAMLRGYIQRWQSDDFTVVEMERAFRFPLVDGWDAGGKFDGIIRRGGALWLMEHKTASRVDAAYLSRLWVDFQIAWYSAAAERVYGEPIVGILYNVLGKLPSADAGMRQGESDAEWEARLAEAKAPGRCKRRMSETAEEYAARVERFYADPSRYHREEILLSRDDVARAYEDMTQAAFEWTEARGSGRWYRNSSQCFKWGSACSYLPICQSRENPLVIANAFRVEDPNRELAPEPVADLAF